MLTAWILHCVQFVNFADAPGLIARSSACMQPGYNSRCPAVQNVKKPHPPQVISKDKCEYMW